MSRIYLAGPDVFRPDALEYAEKVCALVREHGHEPLFPMDNKIPETVKDVSRYIFDSNVEMIRQADIVLARLDPFRGVEPDSGTVWEIGFAAGLGKRVIGYLEDMNPLSRKITGSNDRLVDDNGFTIENFSLPLNLMLAHGVEKLVEGDLAAALEYLNKVEG